MSISPKTEIEDVFTPSIIDKTKSSAKKLASHFFDNPIHYTLWTIIPSILVGLFFGMSFPWQLYLIVLILVIIKIYPNIKKE